MYGQVSPVYQIMDVGVPVALIIRYIEPQNLENGPVEPFRLPVSLRVISAGRRVDYSHRFTYSREELRCKLRAFV